MVVVRVVVVRVLVVRTQNFLSSAPRESGTNEKFSKFSPALKWYERKIFKVQARVVVVCVVGLRTQNLLSPAARGSGSRGSGARVSGTNAKFSKSSRAC